MTDEAGFLAHIRAYPADAVARLAYADWLEEQGGPPALRKAEYLRTDARLAELPASAPEHDALVVTLRNLARELPVEWKAATARLPVENCGLRWDFVCPKQWDRLAPTGDPSARFCAACGQRVRYCGSIEEARAQAWGGGCVVVDLTVVRERHDLDSPLPNPREVMLLGRIAPDHPRPETPPRGGIREWVRRRLRGR